MGLFKKPIIVKCYTNKELANLLSWYRTTFGLSGIDYQEFDIVVVIKNVFDELENGAGVICFEVEIPFNKYKKLKDDLLEKEAFDPILEQRSLAKIIGREL